MIVHEGAQDSRNFFVGFSAELATLIQEHCFLSLKAPVQRVTGFDTVMPYYKLELEYLPNAERIGKGIMECAAY
ncbi:MAG: transketolase C-terminal domain-containing protein [Phycisphaerales bacterium]